MNTHAYKAFTALVATEAAGVGMAMMDGALTRPEVLVATGSALVAAAAVWRVPNPPKTPPPSGPGVGEFL